MASVIRGVARQRLPTLARGPMMNARGALGAPTAAPRPQPSAISTGMSPSVVAPMGGPMGRPKPRLPSIRGQGGGMY